MLSKLKLNRKFSVVAARVLLILVIALFGIGPLLTTTTPARAAAGVTVTWTDVRQTIDGFGASGAFRRATYLMNMTEPNRSAILDALFSQTTGAGLSIVRNIIGDGSTLSDGVPTIEPRRAAWPLFCCRWLWVIGCNAVTRHDARVSVRAGFSGRELSVLWPDKTNWQLDERHASLFSHLFVARKIHGGAGVAPGTHRRE